MPEPWFSKSQPIGIGKDILTWVLVCPDVSSVRFRRVWGLTPPTGQRRPRCRPLTFPWDIPGMRAGVSLASICWHLRWKVRNGDEMESAYVCVR